MENTKKIIGCILLVLTICSCSSQVKKTIKNTLFLVEDSTQNVVFKIPNYNKVTSSENYYVKNDSVFYKYIANQGENIKISDVIDVETFDLLSNDPIDKKKVDNPIYWRGEKMKDVDVETFKTLKVIRQKSEWESTIGMDAKYLYSGNNQMTLEAATNRYYLTEELTKKYFKKE